jgi:hypothetical protein
MRIRALSTAERAVCRLENGTTTIWHFYSKSSTIQPEAQLIIPAQTSHFAQDLTPRQIREVIDQVLNPTTRRSGHHFENPIRKSRFEFHHAVPCFGRAPASAGSSESMESQPAPFSIRVRLPGCGGFFYQKIKIRDGQNCSRSSFERLPRCSCGGKTQDRKRVQVSYYPLGIVQKS